MRTVKEVLITFYSEILESYRNENELTRLRNSMTFYEFVEKMFDRFKTTCKEIEEKELVSIMIGNFTKECTRKRFLNALYRITEEYKLILQMIYQGDLKSAIAHMEELMCGDKLCSIYLPDMYANYMDGDIKTDVKLYRMRDVEKSCGQPDNCWHVPFSYRRYTTSQRYNMSGHPCLYLADSKETANKELGDLKESMNRWCSEFTINKNMKENNGFLVFDLTIPSQETIETENSNYTLLGWLLTYPLRLLCSVKVNEKCNFPDEYIFPQFFFHWKYLMKGYDCGHGFVFSSTKNPLGKNYVFPAKYIKNTPPTYSDKQIGENLQKIFEASEPELYAEGKTKKKYIIEFAEL